MSARETSVRRGFGSWVGWAILLAVALTLAGVGGRSVSAAPEEASDTTSDAAFNSASDAATLPSGAPVKRERKKPKFRRSRLTSDEQEGKADKRRLLLTTGEDKAIDLDFETDPGDKYITVGNKDIVARTLVKIGEKRQLVLKPLKAGETNITLRDVDGNIRLILAVRVVANLEEALAQSLASLRADGLEASWLLVDGAPAPALARIAEERGFDLIVVGTRLGLVLLARLAFVVALLPVVTTANRDPRPRWWAPFTALLVLGIAATPALGGHASVGTLNAVAVAVDALYTRYTDLDGINAAFGASFTSRDDVLAATEAVNPLPFSTGLVVLIIFSVAALVSVDPILALDLTRKEPWAKLPTLVLEALVKAGWTLDGVEGLKPPTSGAQHTTEPGAHTAPAEPAAASDGTTGQPDAQTPQDGQPGATDGKQPTEPQPARTATRALTRSPCQRCCRTG